MNSSMKLAAIVAIALSAGLAGCAAQTEGSDEITDGQDQAAAAQPGEESQPGDATKEQTGEAKEKCGCSGFNGWGWGWPALGAVGFPWSGLFGGCWGGWSGGWGGWSGGWGGWSGCI